MLVSPYYSKPSQEGLYRHFEAIATAVHLPVMLYNVPGRTMVNMAADTVVKLAQIDNVTCVKEASGNLDQMAEIIERTPDDFILYSGDDGLTLPALAIGGHGVVSVAAHVVGNQMTALIEKFLDGQLSEAAQIHRSLLPLARALFANPSPVPVKTLLNQIGVEVGGVRLPMVPLDEEASLQLKRVYERLVGAE
jgi:4-hydroxy-tetrahydrodipicolinate synthase